jgi:hypothetical protein
VADVKLSTPRLRVVLADETDRIVQCTNADLVRFDLTRSKQKWPGPTDAPFLWLTFIAWAALRRTKTIPDTLTYEAFSDSTLEIENMTDEESAADPDRDAVDPFQSDPEPG